MVKKGNSSKEFFSLIGGQEDSPKGATFFKKIFCLLLRRVKRHKKSLLCEFGIQHRRDYLLYEIYCENFINSIKIVSFWPWNSEKCRIYGIFRGSFIIPTRPFHTSLKQIRLWELAHVIQIASIIQMVWAIWLFVVKMLSADCISNVQLWQLVRML